MISWATWVTTRRAIATAPVESINAHQRSLETKAESALANAIEELEIWHCLVTSARHG